MGVTCHRQGCACSRAGHLSASGADVRVLIAQAASTGTEAFEPPRGRRHQSGVTWRRVVSPEYQ